MVPPRKGFRSGHRRAGAWPRLLWAAALPVLLPGCAHVYAPLTTATCHLKSGANVFIYAFDGKPLIFGGGLGPQHTTGFVIDSGEHAVATMLSSIAPTAVQGLFKLVFVAGHTYRLEVHPDGQELARFDLDLIDEALLSDVLAERYTFTLVQGPTTYSTMFMYTRRR